MTLPDKEISLLSTSTPPAFEKACTIGSNEYVAKAGASSIFVQMIFDIVCPHCNILHPSILQSMNFIKLIITLRYVN